MNLNSVVIGGRMTRDAELKYLPNGKAVADCSIAINRVWNNQAGEKQESATFVDVTAWEKSAEILTKYVKKGDSVMFEGTLEQDTWTDKTTNEKRSKLKVRANRVHLVSGNKQTAAASATPASAPNPIDDLEDVPF